MVEFALCVTHIVLSSNSYALVHTLHTSQIYPCTLKIFGNTAFQLAHQNCQFSFSNHEKGFNLIPGPFKCLEDSLEIV